MQEQIEFQGFSKETLKFFKDLKKNNTKKWFQAHKQDYETFVEYSNFHGLCAI